MDLKVAQSLKELKVAQSRKELQSVIRVRNAPRNESPAPIKTPDTIVVVQITFNLQHFNFYYLNYIVVLVKCQASDLYANTI